MRRAVALATFAIAVLTAACSDDGASGTVDGAASGGTVAVAPLPPVATTVAPAPASEGSLPIASAVASAAVPVPTTVAPTSTVSVSSSVRPTTTVSTTGSGAAPPCQLDLIVAQTQTQYLGITPSDLSCAEGWAAWIGRPDDELADGFFAVARWTDGSWELLNLGTAGVCADAGVPDELWVELGCFE